MSKVFFEAKVHFLNDGNKVPRDATTYKLQVRFKDDDNDHGKIAEHRFAPPLKGPIPALVVETDECGSNAALVFGYYRLETKSADTFFGSCSVKVHRGIELVQADLAFKVPDESAPISMTVSITDISAAQQYTNSVSSPIAAVKSDPNKNGDAAIIPMVSIDDVFDSNEAETDSGESVKTFAKELAAQFDINTQNTEELAIAVMRVGDFPVHPDAAHIAHLPSDADIMQVFSIHPADFKKLRESFNRSSDAAGMNAYYDVLHRKSDAVNLYREEDFDWAEDDTDVDGMLVPGSVSLWNQSVEVRWCKQVFG
jgi:hypothetical protein